MTYSCSDLADDECSIEDAEFDDEPEEEHPLDRAAREDAEDRSAGDPRIEDHPFNPRNGSAGDY